MDLAHLVQTLGRVGRSLLARPLLHFLLMGGLLFLGSRLLAPWLEQPQTIIVAPADVERLRAAWITDMKRDPSPQELDASVRRWLDDEILLREALRLHLEQTDRVARNRLLMNLRFVDPGTPLDDDTLLREARALGMTTRDHVVRRRLIDLMEQRLASGVQVSEAQTRDYVIRHADRYATQMRYQIRQLYFSRDLRHQRARQDAVECRQRLTRAAEAACRSDVFLLGDRLRGQTQESLTGTFGEATAKAIAQMEPLQWSAPLESLYGWHLFRIETVEAAGPPDYEQVRRRASYALLAEQEKQAIAEALVGLRKRYEIVRSDDEQVHTR